MAVIDTRALTGPTSALEAQAALREALAEVIEHPTVAGAREIVEGARQVFAVEPDQPELAASRQALNEDLNLLSWLSPGSTEFVSAAMAFRHHLLHHFELTHRLHRRG